MLTRLGIRATQLGWTALVLVLPFLMLQAPATNRTGAPASASDFVVSDPERHENLTVFLIHGKDRVRHGRFLTLQEALEQSKAVVHETGSVNTLEVENLSPDEELFIQSGDVVKGGRQDRLIAFDLLLAPKSGRTAVASCCVEAGRWQPRGKEVASRFTSSRSQLPSKMLKVYGGNYNNFNGNFNNSNLNGNNGPGLNNGNFNNNANNGNNSFGNFGNNSFNLNNGNFNLPNANNNGNNNNFNGQLQGQGGVWSEVGEVQRKLEAKLRAVVRSKESESSLQLTLEHPKVQEAVEKYTRKLAGIFDGQNDVIGYAFAVNNRVNSVEIYGNAELFRRLWPKLLKANALEAFIEAEEGKSYPAVGADAISAVLADAERGDAVEKDITSRVRVLMRETEKNVLFETRDRKRDAWVHKSYLTKQPAP